MKFTVKIVEDLEKFVESFSDDRIKIDGPSIVFNEDETKSVNCYSVSGHDYSFLAEQGGDPNILNFLYPYEVIRGNKDFSKLMNSWGFLLEYDIEESLRNFFSTNTPEHLVKFEQYINEEVMIVVFEVPEEIILLQKLQENIP